MTRRLAQALQHHKTNGTRFEIAGIGYGLVRKEGDAPPDADERPLLTHVKAFHFAILKGEDDFPRKVRPESEDEDDDVKEDENEESDDDGWGESICFPKAKDDGKQGTIGSHPFYKAGKGNSLLEEVY
jgi:hypothetical protein